MWQKDQYKRSTYNANSKFNFSNRTAAMAVKALAHILLSHLSNFKIIKPKLALQCQAWIYLYSAATEFVPHMKALSATHFLRINMFQIALHAFERITFVNLLWLTLEYVYILSIVQKTWNYLRVVPSDVVQSLCKLIRTL